MPSQTFVERLQELRDNLLDVLLDLTASPKPTYSVDGQVYSWNEYYQVVTKQVQDVTQLISQSQPFELKTHGYS